MSESSSRVAIVVALITGAGTLGAALIGNWDKFFGSPPVAAPAPGPTPAPLPSGATLAPVSQGLDLSGLWFDTASPGTAATVTQQGDRLQFLRRGVLANGVGFESRGTGTLAGRQVTLLYQAHYQDGSASQGQCTGQVSVAGDAAQMHLRCSDTLLGVFDSSSVRQ